MQSGRRISWGNEGWPENRIILEASAVCMWKFIYNIEKLYINSMIFVNKIPIQS